MARIYGIDMGTSSLRIYQKGDGLIYNQKNAIAIFDKKKVIAIGDDAWKMEGKTPANIEVTYPFRSGVPADIKNMVTMLNLIFENLESEHGKMTGQDFMIAVPTNITEVERRAYVDLISETIAKPKRIRVVDKPIADALGCGVDIKEVTGTMIVDMGADTIEISVISYGGIVTGKTLDFGGKRMDDSITAAVRKYYNFMIGPKTAEQVKIMLGTAVKPEEEEIETKQVMGRNVVWGLPGRIALDSMFVYLSLKDIFELIVDAVRNILEHIPPEISVDIMTYGVHLTGGLSGIKNIDRLIADSTGLPVYVKSNGNESAAVGLGKIMDDKELDILAERYTDNEIID